MRMERALPSVLVLLQVCAVAASVLAAEAPPPPKPAASAETGSKDKPFIVINPDGTITVQKAPAPEKSRDGQEGLVIPPQVVVPTARVPANDPPIRRTDPKRVRAGL